MNRGISLFLLLAAWPMQVWAEQGKAHTGSFSDLAIFWLNFIVYIAVMYFLLRKPFPVLWAKRRAGIEQGVRASAAELDRAKATLQQSQQKLNNLENDIARLREEMRSETQAEQKALEAYGKVKSEKILARARDNYVAEKRSLEQKLQHEISEMALKLVRERLSSELSSDADKIWRDAALKNVKELVH